MELSSEQYEVLASIKNGRNIFVTGAAGTGKSYLLKTIKKLYQPYGLHVTASTGVAAVNIGGVTLHSWAALGFANQPAHEITKFILSGKGTFIRRKLKKAKMLAIDEVSMIGASTFDLVDEVLRNVRENDKPFGSLQIILFGDFLQLPPVELTKNLDGFCFEAKAWDNANIQTFHLKTIHRQSEDRFIRLLNNLRLGKIDSDDLRILESRKIDPDYNDIKPTIICTHNYQIDNINKTELAKLVGKEHHFTMTCSGKAEKINFLKKNCMANENLILKIGAQVMMLKNTYQKDGIINGSLGIVKGFNSQGLPIVYFNNGKTILIEKEEWASEEFNHELMEAQVNATVRQIPLVLAWAITVHKSQGMSLDAIECNLDKSFVEGQVYVALSRVKSLEGLYIKNFDSSIMKINPKVVKFYQEFEKDLC